MFRAAAIMMLASVGLIPIGASPVAEHVQASVQEPDWHQPLDHSAPIGFFIAPDDGADSAAQLGDAELARWALQAWERAAQGRFELVAAVRRRALVHLYWASGAENLYGEMRPFLLGDKRGAAVFVLPETKGLGLEIDRAARHDSLFRDTIVYLTCLHELGHAFGLAHTDEYEDIMYSFQYGGDIVRYFQRYRKQLHERQDIAARSGLSPSDIARLRALYDPAR